MAELGNCEPFSHENKFFSLQQVNKIGEAYTEKHVGHREFRAPEVLYLIAPKIASSS
jgi:hypothetical protein